jgi:hypothetical protein
MRDVEAAPQEGKKGNKKRWKKGGGKGQVKTRAACGDVQSEKKRKKN